MGRFVRAREILTNELEAVRQQHADLDTHEVTAFTIPLLTRAVLLVTIGVIALMVVRAGDDVDEVFVSVVASFALAAVAAAVITWLFAIILSTFITMVIYRKPPKQSSRLATRTIDDSFGRIEDVTSAFMLLALVVGLIALAVGLPTRSNADASTSVVEDLLMAQVAILLAILAIAFLAEAARASADVVDDQSPALAWPWALFIIATAWVLATVAGPLEFTTMVRRLLVEWLPATIDGIVSDVQNGSANANITTDTNYPAKSAGINVSATATFSDTNGEKLVAYEGDSQSLIYEVQGADGTYAKLPLIQQNAVMITTWRQKPVDNYGVELNVNSADTLFVTVLNNGVYASNQVQKYINQPSNSAMSSVAKYKPTKAQAADTLKILGILTAMAKNAPQDANYIVETFGIRGKYDKIKHDPNAVKTMNQELKAIFEKHSKALPAIEPYLSKLAQK